MAQDHEDDGDDDGGQDEQDDGSSHGFSFLTCGNIGSKRPGDGLTSRGWPNLDKRSDMTEANPDPAERKRQLAREAQRRYRAKNGEKLQGQNRQYYQRNRKTLLEKRREYNEANRDKRREYQRRYMAENGQAVRERDRQRWRDNRELNRERRRARVHGLTADQWAAMWAAQDGCCYLCRCPMELDEAIVEHWHGCAVPHNSGESCHRCRRGLAHYLCNNIIGAAADDPAVLRVIADNLERANADVAARQAVMPQHITLF